MGQTADWTPGRSTSQGRSGTNTFTAIRRYNNQPTDRSRIVLDAAQMLNRVYEQMSVLEEQISVLARMQDLVHRSSPNEVPRGPGEGKEEKAATDTLDRQRPLTNPNKPIPTYRSRSRSSQKLTPTISSKSSSVTSRTTPGWGSRQTTPLPHRASPGTTQQTGEVDLLQPREKTVGVSANSSRAGNTEGPYKYTNLNHLKRSLNRR